jgi:hypothetical protein
MTITQQQGKELARAAYPGNFAAIRDLLFALANGDFVGPLDSSQLTNLDGITATAALINAVAAGTRATVTVTDAASYTVLAADSGKVHICPDFTASCTMTLPAVADGLRYRFVGKGVAADAQNWVFTAPASAFLKGGVAFADNDAGAGADEIHAGLYPNGSSNLTLTVVTPAAGTYIEFVCDGTNYIVNGWVNSATVPAFS